MSCNLVTVFLPWQFPFCPCSELFMSFAKDLLWIQPTNCVKHKMVKVARGHTWPLDIIFEAYNSVVVRFNSPGCINCTCGITNGMWRIQFDDWLVRYLTSILRSCSPLIGNTTLLWPTRSSELTINLKARFKAQKLSQPSLLLYFPLI